MSKNAKPEVPPTLPPAKNTVKKDGKVVVNVPAKSAPIKASFKKAPVWTVHHGHVITKGDERRYLVDRFECASLQEALGKFTTIAKEAEGNGTREIILGFPKA